MELESDHLASVGRMRIPEGPGLYRESAISLIPDSRSMPQADVFSSLLLQYHQIVPVDHLVVQLVAKAVGDFPAFGAKDFLHLVG